MSLSTHLLQNLSVSTDHAPLPTDHATTSFSLPLVADSRDRRCEIRATLLRNNSNTITVDLRAEHVMVNATPLTFDVVEPRLQHVEPEGDSGESQHSSELGPSSARLLCQNEV